MKKGMPFSRILQICSVMLIAMSICPCLYTLINIPSVILFAIQEGGNLGLQIYGPLITAAMINGIGFVLLVISLFVKDRSLPSAPPE